MLALRRSSREVVVADEELNDTDMMSELLGKRQCSTYQKEGRYHFGDGSGARALLGSLLGSAHARPGKIGRRRLAKRAQAPMSPAYS